MFRIRSFLAVLVLFLASPFPVSAQGVGGAGGGLGGGGAGGGGLGGGGLGGGGAGGGANASGIKIDAQGVVTLAVDSDGSVTLDKKRKEAYAKRAHSQDVNHKVKLRMVSLVELERQIDDTLSKGHAISEEMFYLAGLQRIDHVFVFPDERDVVIAGPAEGYVPDMVGRLVGADSGRPVLRLDDLFIALRTVAKSSQVGCSIDPVPERIAELRNFIREGGPSSVEEVEARFNRMDDILGLQNVRIDGVPEDSHFATMLVEADYRMKRISMGLENPAIKGLKSHLAMMGSGGNAMQRWWFVPFYDALYRSDDHLAFQFVGQRAKLVAEDELIDASGNRSSAPVSKKTTLAFAKQFTEKFAQLAEKSPVFGELQNLIDWTVFAALLHKEQIPHRIGWKQELLLDESRLTYPKFLVPKKIPSQVSYKRNGNLVVGLVGGGVVVNPQRTLEQAEVSPKDSATLDAIRTAGMTAPRNESHHWWWDCER